MNLPDLHRGALASTRSYLAAVAPGQWHEPTPCAEYDVRMLVNHIVSGNFWVADLMRKLCNARRSRLSSGSS